MAKNDKKLRIHEVLAVLEGARNTHKRAISDLHHRSQHAPSYNGMVKTFRPKDLGDEGEAPWYPNEEVVVQVRADDVLRQGREIFSDLFNVTATLDFGNLEATADVKVGDQILLKDAPVTYLIFLEKQLQDVRTFVAKLPERSASDTWESDDSGLHKTPKIVQNKTKKRERPVVVTEPTEHQKAEWTTITDDYVEGFWDTVKLTGAVGGEEKRQFLARIETLSRAVKKARTEANSSEVEKQEVADPIFDFLFNPQD